MPTASVTICVGNFDGVHLGHEALVRRAREVAGAGRVLVMAFDPHPATVLRPGPAPGLLTPFERRAELLRARGADEVARLEPTPDLLRLAPEAFIDDVISGRSVEAFVEGEDFRFGRGRAGDLDTLRELGASRGFRVEVIGPVEVALTDQMVTRASSTLARELVAAGRVRDVAAVLGRPYELIGEVVRGDRRGRNIGYPTANLETPQLLPADGVYAAHAILPDGRREPAALSVGTKPMFGGETRVAEAFLLDAPREGDAIASLPEYGWPLRVEVLGWVREQMRFASVRALVEQMDRDCARVRDVLHTDVIVPWDVNQKDGEVTAW